MGWEGSALAGMALTSVLAHKFELCLEEAERATTLGRAISSAAILAAAQLATGFVQVVTGHLEQAETNLTTAHEISRSQSRAFHHALSSMLLGLLENWRGNYEIAIARSEEAIGVARRHHHAFALMQGQFAHGLARTGRGDYDDALRAFNEGLALAEKLGSGFFHSRFLNSLGWIHVATWNAPSNSTREA